MSTVDPSPDAAPSRHRAAYAMVAHEVMRDPTLSVDAKMVWTLLDGHAGEHYFTRIRQETLAEEMGLSRSSLSRVKRAIAELKNRGLIVVERTGRSNRYRVLNPSRMTHPGRHKQQPKSTQKQPQNADRANPDLSDRADTNLSDRAVVSGLHKKNPLRTNNARTNPRQDRDPVPVAEALAAAAGSFIEPSATADPLAVETLLEGLPDHLRPQSTAAIAEALAAAVARGWTPEHLAAAVADQIPNPTAGPGLAVKILRELSQQPPGEHQRRREKPSWCGLCDESTRLLEGANGNSCRCHLCHPLAAERHAAAEDCSLNSEEPRLDTSGWTDMIRADLQARRTAPNGTDALVDELALAEPVEALTDPQSGSEAAADAVIA